MSVLDIQVYQDWQSDEENGRYRFVNFVPLLELSAEMKAAIRFEEQRQEEKRLNEKWKAKRTAARSGTSNTLFLKCPNCHEEKFPVPRLNWTSRLDCSSCREIITIYRVSLEYCEVQYMSRDGHFHITSQFCGPS